MSRAFEPDRRVHVGPPPQPTGSTFLLLVTSLGECAASLACAFEGSNWRLVRASSSEDALIALGMRRFPVVICDADVPGFDWQGFCREALKLPVPPRLLVSSRFADDTLWAEAVGVGAEDVLPAPFEPGEALRLAFLAWCAWEHAKDVRWCSRIRNRISTLCLPGRLARS